MRTAMFLAAAAVCLQLTASEVQTGSLSLKGGDEASRKAYFAQKIRVWGSNGFLKDPSERYDLYSLRNAGTEYVLALSGKTDAAGRFCARIGMIRPSEANWAASDFFSFELDEIPVFPCFLDRVQDRENGFRFLFSDGTARHTSLDVFLDPSDRKLYLEFAPGTNVRTYSVKFIAYPGSYGGGWKKGLALRRRQAETPVRKLDPDPSMIRLRPDEPWVLLRDLYFDPALNREGGPCAILTNPAACSRAEVCIRNYECFLRYSFSGNKKSFFILWDFTGWSNADALKQMKSLELSF